MVTRNYKETYICDDCGAEDVKLWREYQTFLNHQTFRCVDCLAEHLKDDEYAFDPDLVDDEGRGVVETLILAPAFSNGTQAIVATFRGRVAPKRIYNDYEVREERSDQLGGWYIPAIPTAEGDTFWGYTSWTEERRADWDWWLALPTHKAQVSA